MAKISHLENREIIISQQQKSYSDEIWYTTAYLELDGSQMTTYEHCQNSGWQMAAML